MIGPRLLRLTKDALIYGVGAALSSFIGIFLVPVLTRSLTPADYGVVDLLSTVIFLATVLFSFGFDTASAIMYFEDDSEERRRQTLSTSLLFVGAVTLIIMTLAFPWSRAIAQTLFHQPDLAPVIRYTLSLIPLVLLFGFALAALRYRFARVRYLMCVSLNVILTIVLTIVFVGIFDRGVLGFFQAWFLAALGSTVLALSLSWSSFRPAWSKKQLKKLLKIGLPIVPAGLAGWSLSLIDRFFLNSYSLEAVGLYSLGVKISSILGLGISALQLAWGPFALSFAHQPGAKETYAKVLTIYVVLASVTAMLITALAPQIITLSSRREFLAAATVVGPLVLGLIAYGAYYIISIGISISQQTAQLSITTTIAAITNVILNIVLIPRWGMYGAAVATLLSYVLSTYLLYRAAQRHYPIPYEVRKVILTFLIAVMSVITISLLPFPLSWDMIVIKSGLIALAIGLFFLTRIIEPEEIRAIRVITAEAIDSVTKH